MTFIYTDQPIVILVMAKGVLSAVDTHNDSRFKVTMKRVVQGRTEYLNVNRVFDVVCVLRGGSESASPSEKDFW